MVLLKEPVTPPRVRVVVAVVLGVLAAVWRRHTDWPGLRVAGLLVKVAEQPIEYSPPLTETAVGVL